MASLWRAETKPQQFDPLIQNVSCNLLVVGSGIAGLSGAYEAARCGVRVVLIDRQDITKE